ncbi:MAG: hypothetical protein PVI15_09790, partial [Chromatiales bacterium]
GMQFDEQGRPQRAQRPDWAPQRPPRPEWAGRGMQFDEQGRPVRPERPPRPAWAGRGMQFDDNGRPMRPQRPDWAPRRPPYGQGRGPMPPAGYAPQQATPPATPQYGPNSRWAPTPRPGFRPRPAWAARPFYGPRPLPGYPPHRGNGNGNGNGYGKGVAPVGPGPMHRGPKLVPPNGPAIAQRPAWGPRTYWWRPMPAASRFRPRSAPMRPPADYGYHRRPHAPAQMYAMGPSLRPW